MRFVASNDGYVGANCRAVDGTEGPFIAMRRWNPTGRRRPDPVVQHRAS